MKKALFLLPVLLIVGVAFLSSPPSGQTSNAVQVPEALKLIISGLILTGVTLGLQVVFDWLGLDLRGVGAMLAATLSGFAIAQLQGYIDVIPAQYDYLITIVLNILVVILSGLGYIRAISQRERAALLFSPR